MKIFYINNFSCADCGRCVEVCPTRAVYRSDGKYLINYDNCTSCGNCLKECVHKAVSLEKVEKIVRGLEELHEHRSRISELEVQNSALNNELASYVAMMHRAIEKLPFAAVVTGADGAILLCNEPFRSISVEANGNGSPIGANIREYTGENIANVIYNTSFEEGKSISHITTIGTRNVALSVHSIEKGGTSISFIRDLHETSVANEESVRIIKESIDRQMSMVQKIGFLLGEEISEISRNLDNIIKINDRRKDG